MTARAGARQPGFIDQVCLSAPVFIDGALARAHVGPAGLDAETRPPARQRAANRVESRVESIDPARF
jgi:hypothetical protein